MKKNKTLAIFVIISLVFAALSFSGVSAKETCSWVTYGGNLGHNGISKNECLPSSDTSILFSKEYEEKIVCHPVFADNKLIFPTKDGKLFCIDTKTNDEIWSLSDLSTRVEFPPFISSENLFQVSYKDLIKIDMETGKVVDEFESDSRITTAPICSDGFVFFGTKDGKLVCLDEKTLKEKWSFETGKQITSLPSVLDEKIFLGSNDKKVYCVNLKSGAKVWDFVAEDVITNPIVIADNKIYVTSGSSLFGFDPDGTPRWKFKTYSDITSVAADEKHVFCTTTNFKLQCIDATFCGATCCIKPAKELWFTNIPKGKMEIESITDTSVTVTCESDDMVCIDVTDGNSFWKKNFDYDLDKTIIVSNRIFVVDDNELKIFADSPEQLEYRIGESEYGRDSYKITMDTKPIILHDRTFLPARYVVEPLGGEISWDGITKEITVSYGDTEIVVTIGKATATVNGKSVNISDDKNVAPVIVDDRTLIPLRFIAENMNCEVGYEASTKTISLKNLKK